MTIEQSMEQLASVYAHACQGQSRVVVVTGDAGIGKSWLMQSAVAKHDAAVSLLMPFFDADTPLTLTERILSRWSDNLTALLDNHTGKLAEQASRLGLSMDLVTEWLGTLSTHDDRMAHIRQHLPWLKKMTPGLKTDVDQLLDLLASPWLGIAQKHKTRLPDALSRKTPSELAHVLVDEWVWLHQQLPSGASSAIWSLWLDGLDALAPVDADTRSQWQTWLNALINAVATAEQLKAMLVISCRSNQLSHWLSPTFHRTTPVLLGPLPFKRQKALIAAQLDGIPIDDAAWDRFYDLTHGNPALARMLALGLAQRRSLFLDGLTVTRLDTLGLTSERALQDWWLVPLQLTPGIDDLGVQGIRHLLHTVAQQPEPFTAPALLTRADIDESQPKRLQAAFSLLQQLLHVQLIAPSDTPLHYQVFCRYVLEQLAERFSLASQPEQPGQQQETLANVLEVTLLTGQLDQQQLSDLWQWCQQSDDPQTLTALWVSLAERAVQSPYHKVIMSGLVALSLSQTLQFHHVQPLLTREGIASMAWRLACELPWHSADNHPLDTDDSAALVSNGLAHRQSDIRACALQCAQKLNVFNDTQWLQTALNDSTPWVRRQALLAIQHLQNPDMVPVNSLLKLATQPEPDVLPVVLPLLISRVAAETTVPIALEQWAQTQGTVQTQWLNFLRQVPLSTPVEHALLNALTQAESPDLIWTLYQKLWKDAAGQHDTLLALTQASDTPWPDWLKAAIRQRCLAESRLLDTRAEAVVSSRVTVTV